MAKTIKKPKVVPAQAEIDPATEIEVLFVTTDYGQKYTCRTVAELGTFLTNFKKKQPTMGLSISYGKMTEGEYSKIPPCKYFTKT